jgi:hypothetical protein
MTQGKTAAITGGIGDICFAIPVMRALGITRLYIKENFYPAPYGSMYTAVKPLLELQGIECLPTKGGLDFEVYEEGLQFDIDLDHWRHERGRGRDHIMMSMLCHWRKMHRDWRRPWIKGIPVAQGEYSLCFLTWRWRDNSRVDWKKVYASIPRPVYFIGLPEDHELWEREVCPIEWWPTNNLLEMAKLIAGCKALYCNQGVALVLAQGLGKEYYCSFKPGKTNCHLRTPNEHDLNLYKQYEKAD